MILGMNGEPGECSMKTAQTASILFGCSLLIALIQLRSFRRPPMQKPMWRGSSA